MLGSRTRHTVGHQSVSAELLRCSQYVMYFEFGEVVVHIVSREQRWSAWSALKEEQRERTKRR